MIWGGGYEEVSVQTVETKLVRDAINAFRNVLRDDLNIYIEKKNIRWRNDISKAIIARLRDEIGDEHVSNDDIRRITKSILLGICDLPAPQLPDLPPELSTTGRLQGGSVSPFMGAAGKYMDALKEAGDNFSRNVEQTLKDVQCTQVGALIFGSLHDEAESLMQQLQNKRFTADKYLRLQKALQDVSA